MITNGPLINVGVAVGATVGVFVGWGVGVAVGHSVGSGVCVSCSVGSGNAVGCAIVVGVAEGVGERVGEGVYVGNKPIARIDVSTIAAARQPQQHKAIPRGITGKTSLLPAIVGLIRTDSSLRNMVSLTLPKNAQWQNFHLFLLKGKRRPNIPLPTFRWIPDLVVGIPVLRATLCLAREIPNARFHEKDRPGIPVLVLRFFGISLPHELVMETAQRLAAEPPRGPGKEPPLNAPAAGSTTSANRRDSAVGSSRGLCSAPEWMKTVPNPGPTRRCRTAP